MSYYPPLIASLGLVFCVLTLGFLDTKPTEVIVDLKPREIPNVVYDSQKNQCVLIYPDTMIVRECK